MVDRNEARRLRFEDKIAIVTGGCKGIGRGCVDVFVAHGGKVAVFDIDGASGTILQSTERGHGEVFFIQCDMSSEEQIKSAIAKTVDKFGKIDCLVNNAGWHPPAKPIDEFSAIEFRQLLDLNLVGYFLTCKYALPYLREARGSIVNIASTANTVSQADAVTYCATKGGVSAMTRALAIDESKHGVRVNTISPGQIWTPLFEEWADSLEDKSQVEKIKYQNHFHRFGQPQEVGQACLFLATEATFSTGVDLNISGGFELGGGLKN